MKNVQLIALALVLSACNVKVDGTPTTITAPAPETAKKETATAPSKSVDAGPVDGNTDSAPTDPVASTPHFCIPHELRDIYSDPIPTTGALYVALVHDGVSDRKADPTCFLDHNVVSGGRRYIACAVTLAGTAFGHGPFYNHMFAAPDRPWIEAALEREASLDNLRSDEITVTVESAATPFASDAALSGQAMVMISLDESVSFDGYCQ